MIAVNQNDATMNSRRGMETTDAYNTVGESSRSTPFPAKRKLWSDDHDRRNAGQRGKSEPKKRGLTPTTQTIPLTSELSRTRDQDHGRNRDYNRVAVELVAQQSSTYPNEFLIDNTNPQVVERQ